VRTLLPGAVLLQASSVALLPAVAAHVYSLMRASVAFPVDRLVSDAMPGPASSSSCYQSSHSINAIDPAWPSLGVHVLHGYANMYV
jgi:hypothetical protein